MPVILGLNSAPQEETGAYPPLLLLHLPERFDLDCDLYNQSRPSGVGRQQAGRAAAVDSQTSCRNLGAVGAHPQPSSRAEQGWREQ